MKILAIDTSSNICSCSIFEDNNLIKEVLNNDGNTHSVILMPQIQELLSSCNLSLKDIDLLACDKGPGSFTGIRIGISTVKAFCDVTNINAIGISSLLSLAYTSNYKGYICSLIDAKNDNVYFGLFDNSNGEYLQIGQYLAENIRNIIEILKKCNKPIFFVGNGSIVYKDMLESILNEIEIINNEKQYIDTTSKSLALVAFDIYSLNKFSDVEYSLSPLYLKKSSAEIELEEKQNASNNS